VEAVAGSERLREAYTNVVVFSQRGARPLTSCLSGSDLDGDLYAVIWDERLLVIEYQEPMDYTAPKPVEVCAHLRVLRSGPFDCRIVTRAGRLTPEWTDPQQADSGLHR
jgi:hypothetical protein